MGSGVAGFRETGFWGVREVAWEWVDAGLFRGRGELLYRESGPADRVRRSTTTADAMETGMGIAMGGGGLMGMAGGWAMEDWAMGGLDMACPTMCFLVRGRLGFQMMMGSMMTPEVGDLEMGAMGVADMGAGMRAVEEM